MGSGASAGSSVEYPRDKESIIDKLSSFRKNEPVAFEEVMAAVHKQSRCAFQPDFPNVVVNDVAPVDEEQKAAFHQKYLNKEYHKEDRERGKNSVKIQYIRWDWAVHNISTYVNVLRVAGHEDTNIQAMFDGRPMCWKAQAIWDEFRAALGVLEVQIETEMGWDAVQFVHCGSSVPGFSQNPFKGLRDLPSKVTDPNKSDVDICIVGNGVNDHFTKLEDEIQKDLAHTMSISHYPSTSCQYTRGMRFGLQPTLEGFSKCIHDFHKTWSAKLPGGLQITFAEEDSGIPPWEIYIQTIKKA